MDTGTTCAGTVLTVWRRRLIDKATKIIKNSNSTLFYVHTVSYITFELWKELS